MSQQRSEVAVNLIRCQSNFEIIFPRNMFVAEEIHPVICKQLHYERLKSIIMYLTEIAGEGGPDLAPQKFLLSQKFRHLMG